jgi:hypothetical protein
VISEKLRVSNGNHQLPHAKRLGIAQRCGHKVRGLDSHYSQIRFRVVTDQVGLKTAAVGERYLCCAGVPLDTLSRTAGINPPVPRVAPYNPLDSAGAFRFQVPPFRLVSQIVPWGKIVKYMPGYTP